MKLEREIERLREKFGDLQDQINLQEKEHHTVSTIVKKPGLTKPTKPEPPKGTIVAEFKTVCINCKHVRRNLIDSYECGVTLYHFSTDYTTQTTRKSYRSCADVNDGDCKKFEQVKRISIIGRCIDFINKHPVFSLVSFIILGATIIVSVAAISRHYSIIVEQ